jgi:aminoglycoside 3-N-acetyltransferase
MVTYRTLLLALQDLGLHPRGKIIAHASISRIGEVAGGVETFVGALLACCEGLMVPTFTPQTMVVPPFGPPDNAMTYAQVPEEELPGPPFDAALPADTHLGLVPETVRTHPDAERSLHPLLSFAGVNVREGLEAQSLEDPWAPIGWLAEVDGDVLLVGADHRRNVSLHYAMAQAGRKEFLRWARLRGKIVECPGWPGCSEGFEAIGPRLGGVVREGTVGGARAQLIPLRDLLHIAVGWLREDPSALLCDRKDCRYCEAVRGELRSQAAD